MSIFPDVMIDVRSARRGILLSMMAGVALCGASADGEVDVHLGVNPIVPDGEYLSDPAPRVGPDGRLYLFGSRDESPGKWCNRANDVMVTDDLKTWSIHRDALVSSGAGDAIRGTDAVLYAPDAIWHDGLWHLFFCTPSRNYREGVISSPSPFGPFSGEHKLEEASEIDPSVFRDDDGTFYYTYGQFKMKMAKLKPDLGGIEPGTLKDGIIDEKRHNFHEGSQLTKRGDTYYLVYADIGRRRRPTCIGYSTAKSPFGPYTYRGVIVDNYGCDPDTWNNHGGIVEYKGRWYVFYHRSTDGRHFRKACVEPIEFGADGLIKEVEMTSGGAGGDLDPLKSTPARLACVMSGHARIAKSTAVGKLGCAFGGKRPSTIERLVDIRDGDTATWRYYNFTTRATELKLDVVSHSGGRITLKDDRGVAHGEVSVPPGDGKAVTEVKMKLAKAIDKGRCGVVLSFCGDPSSRILDLDSFCFK